MSARDELVDLIEDSIDDAIYNAADAPPSLVGIVASHAADAILAAGYRKPRTITTAEELDALPDDAVIRTEGGVTLEKWGGEDDPEWRVSGHRPWTTIELAASLPATVLYEPTP